MNLLLKWILSYTITARVLLGPFPWYLLKESARKLYPKNLGTEKLGGPYAVPALKVEPQETLGKTSRAACPGKINFNHCNVLVV